MTDPPAGNPPAAGHGWFAPHPECPDHGQMTPDPSAPPGEPRWICRGFDGEGCPVTVDWTDVEWLPLGTFGDIRLAEVNAHAAVDLAPGEVTTLAELFGRPRFHCPRCGAASSSADDIAAGYCGACHDWTGRPAE